MTQQEIVQEFSTYTAVEQAALLSRLAHVMQRNLERKNDNGHNEKNSVEDIERIAAINRLKGIAKTENPPITKEETREEYYNYLAEKYS